MLVDQNNAAGLLFGAITAVDKATCRIRVSLADCDGMQTYWIHVPQKNAHLNRHRSLPDLGAHARPRISRGASRRGVGGSLNTKLIIIILI